MPYGTTTGGTGRGPAGQVMPNMPLVQGSTGGWQPASTVSGLAANNRASANSRAFALHNQPRLNPLAQDRHRALTQHLATSKTYQAGDGGDTSLGGNNGAGGLFDFNAAIPGLDPNDAMQQARNRLGTGNVPGVPLSLGERRSLDRNFTNSALASQFDADADIQRQAAQGAGTNNLAMQRLLSGGRIAGGQSLADLYSLQTQGQGGINNLLANLFMSG